MDDKLIYILKYTKRKKSKASKKIKLCSSFQKKLGRYNSEILIMKDKKIIGSKDKLPLKNLEFEGPKNESSPQKFEGKKGPNFKNKLLHLNKPNLDINKNLVIKNISVFNKIKSKNILIKNKILKPFIATIHNNIKDSEKKVCPNSFSVSDIKNKKNVQNMINCSNKNSQTENIDVLLKTEKKRARKEINPLFSIKKEKSQDRVPINTLKFFHSKLFRNNKKFHRRKIDSNENIKIYTAKNINESYGTSQLNDNISVKYEMMEFDDKKKFIASKLLRRKGSSPLYDLKPKEKSDFHFIMKHPFSNNFFCSSFINHLTYYNNSYINDYSEKFQHLNNPLKDADLIKKLHNLIINPNTSKIRNGQLLLMYKNYPKGTFYGDKRIINEKIYVENELKKLENTKYRNLVKKINETMNKAKEMRKELDEELHFNQKNL